MKPNITFDGPRMRVRYTGRPTQMVVYDFAIALDREPGLVRLVLPTDLTAEEAERLKRIIDSLVLPEEEAA